MFSRKSFFLRGLLGFCAGWSALCADEIPFLKADFSYASSQVSRGIKRTGAAAQAAVEIAEANWRVNCAGSRPFSTGQEQQCALGAAWQWPDWSGVQLETSVRQSWFAHALGGAVKQSTEIGLTAALPTIKGLTPRLNYGRDLRMRADVVEVQAAHSFALTSLGMFVDCAVFSGWADGDDWRPDAAGATCRDSYRFWGAEAQLPYRVGAHSTVVVAVRYTDEQGRSAVNGPVGLDFGKNLGITFGVSLDF